MYWIYLRIYYWSWSQISAHLNIHQRKMSVLPFSCYLFCICFLLFRWFWRRNICLNFLIFVWCNFAAIFSFCFDSHSFRKSPRSDTLIQSTKNTYTWQMTQVPLEKVKTGLINNLQGFSNVQTINWCLTFFHGASSSNRTFCPVIWSQFIPIDLIFAQV